MRDKAYLLKKINIDLNLLNENHIDHFMLQFNNSTIILSELKRIVLVEHELFFILYLIRFVSMEYIPDKDLLTAAPSLSHDFTQQ